MRTKLLLLFLIFSSTITLAQVVANQIDDFEDGTTQNWMIGNPGSAPSPPMNVATGGPNGADDNFLEYSSSGSNGQAGSKMVFFNTADQWSGNFTSTGVVGIRFDVQVLTNDLNLRIAFLGSGTRICTTNAIPVTAGGGWTTVTIPILASDMEVVIGGSTVETALTNVTTMRILSSSVPAWDDADLIDATIRIDNVTAITSLGVGEQTVSSEFKIIQNPSKSKLMLSLASSNSEVKLDVFDVLGKKVLTKQLNGLTSSIDVSKWNNGVYLVRVTSDTGAQTKRFIKQ